MVSPQIEPDGRVTFRILAPQATAVSVGGDINGSLGTCSRAGSGGRATGGPPHPQPLRQAADAAGHPPWS